MLPPSLRTGACRTHHQRVITTSGLSGLDIRKTLPYVALPSYVSAHDVSSDTCWQQDVSCTFEILFEIPLGETSWAASKANPSSSPAPAAASDARPRCCLRKRERN